MFFARVQSVLCHIVREIAFISTKVNFYDWNIRATLLYDMHCCPQVFSIVISVEKIDPDVRRSTSVSDSRSFMYREFPY